MGPRMGPQPEAWHVVSLVLVGVPFGTLKSKDTFGCYRVYCNYFQRLIEKSSIHTHAQSLEPRYERVRHRHEVQVSVRFLKEDIRAAPAPSALHTPAEPAAAKPSVRGSRGPAGGRRRVFEPKFAKSCLRAVISTRSILYVQYLLPSRHELSHISTADARR